MKIVLLQDDFPPESKGGAGNMAATLAHELHRAGHEVSVIAATQDKKNVGVEIWRGIPVHRFFSDYHERWRAYVSLYNPRTVKKVRLLLEQLAPDVVHAHNIHTHLSYATLVSARRYAKKVMLTAHDEMLFHYGKFYEYEPGVRPYTVGPLQLLRRFRFRYNPLRNIGIRFCMRGVSVVALSHVHQDMLADNGYTATVVYNGIDPHEWSVSTELVGQCSRKYGLANKRVVLFAGRISRLKGADATMAMLTQLRMRIPEAHLLVAGAKGNNTPEVTYTGWLSSDEMKAVYGASEVVVFPSIYFDPFGLVNIEAMAAGKPVVATTFGGAPEIVVDNETGYVVDPRDTELFAQKVYQILANKAVAEKMGEAGRNRLEEYFTAAQMAKAYISLYQKETTP